MAVNLRKGQKVNLTKDTGLKLAMFGLGWDINRYQGSKDFDLDLVLFELGSNGRCIDEEHFIFYSNTKDPEGAVEHSGDNRTGAGDGDDESVVIDFSKINPKVEKIVVAVTIYDGKANGQNFGMVDNSYIRMINQETGEEVLRFDLGEDFDIQTAVVFAEIYKMNGEWKFRAVGEGYESELIDFCSKYGIDVE